MNFNLSSCPYVKVAHIFRLKCDQILLIWLHKQNFWNFAKIIFLVTNYVAFECSKLNCNKSFSCKFPDLSHLEKTPQNGFNGHAMHLNHMPFMQMSHHENLQALMHQGMNLHELNGSPLNGSAMKNHNLPEMEALARYNAILRSK